METTARRVMVIGLDCLEPSLVFDKWRHDLPTLSRLMHSGAYGRLESCHPPITVPAWASMLSSRDPGQLGFYGFRNRADHSYGNLAVANSRSVTAPRVWDVVSQAGMRSVVVGVPQTYPVQPINGWMIGDFLTPPGAAQWTHPTPLADEVTAVLDGEPYEFDVRDFRTDDRAWLLEAIYRMTRKRWRVLRHLAVEKPWDFFMAVEMGTDRIHHGFWSAMDHDHFRYEPGNPYENAIHDYYVYLDGEIAQLLEMVGDETIVVVVSDHGAKRMDGGFCVNQWLQQQGYLALTDQPTGVVPLRECTIDWSRTRAWGEGGYYARIFLNVEGREPSGTIPATEYEAERDRLKRALEATTDPQGRPLGTVVLKPGDVYRETNGVVPDLIVYFGALAWRSVGSVGHPSLHTFDNDTGPDDANHAQHGLIILHDPRAPQHGRELSGLQLECVGPTLLRFLGLEPPPTMMGTPIDLTGDAGVAYTPEQEAAITRHLAALGYVE